MDGLDLTFGLGSTLANIWGANKNKEGVDSTNETNERIARDNRSWQTEMSNTAYQRSTDDLRKAGLNPILAVTGGGGLGPASTPSGSTAVMQNPNGAFQGLGSTAFQAYQGIREMQKIESSVNNLDADSKQKSAAAELALAQAQKTHLEAGNVGSAGGLIEAQTRAKDAERRYTELLSAMNKPQAEASKVGGRALGWFQLLGKMGHGLGSLFGGAAGLPME